MSTSDVELRQEEMNSPAPQHTHTLILYICTHTLWPEFVYPARSGPTHTPPPLSSFDVWKVEGNQSHFLHSGRCRLWFPGAGGATLAVKYSCASGVWEVYGATHSAKNNRGKCWSKASTRGRRKGRWSRHRNSPSKELCTFSSTLCPHFQNEHPISVFNHHRLTHYNSINSEDEKSLFKTPHGFLKFRATFAVI